MPVNKLIAVIAEWEAASKYVKKIVEEVSKKLNINLEIKNEDWDFLATYGQKDEYGGVEVPQIFIEDDKGNIKFIMGRVPLDEEGKPDLEKGKKILEEIIKNYP
ncbi:MAG: hypothetical protein RQ968_01320 [Thermoproteota archaeon]|jgi:hypothetical protein|nr:hypothetical protein [Thermoproteota archaeon]